MRHPPRTLLPLAFAWSFAVFAVAAPQVVDATRYHLGVAGMPEWKEFENSTPHGTELTLSFIPDSSPAESDAMLFIRQRNVKVAWHVALNGQRIGTLEPLHQPLIRALAIPGSLLKTGENHLRISRSPTRMLDDIVIDEITLDARSRASVFGESTLAVIVTEADAATPVPCRLTFVDAVGALVPLQPLPGQSLAVRTGVVYTGDGRARIGIAPGIYTIYASRGFEYSAPSARVTIARGESKSLTLQLRREVPTPDLIAADTHIHTLTHSKHGDATIDERMLTIAGEGIELAVATEHNHHADYAQPAANAGVSRHFHSIIGNEVSTKVGHFNAFPVPVHGPVPDAKLTDWPQLLTHIRGVTGARVITLNHPRDAHSGFTPFGPENFHALTGELLRADKFDCDAVEVITSAAMHSDPMQLFRDWFALLNHGHRVAAIAASDTHDVTQFILGQARTYVVTGANSTNAIDLDEIWESFRAGRVLVSFGLLTSVRLNERFAVGDVATDLGDELKIDIEVFGPSWIAADKVELFANGIKVRELPLSPTSRVEKGRVTLTLPRPKHDVHLVAIATGPGVTAPFWETPRPYQPTSVVYHPRVIGATNPVWIDGDGDGQISSARAQAAALIARHGADLSSLTTELNRRDAAVRIQADDLLARRHHDAAHVRAAQNQ